jgi:hypothetical protein
VCFALFLTAYLCDHNADDLPEGISGRNLMLASGGFPYQPTERTRLVIVQSRGFICITATGRKAAVRAFLRRAMKTHAAACAPSAQTSRGRTSAPCLTPVATEEFSRHDWLARGGTT